MKRYHGGIRHDYKLTADNPRSPRWRAVVLFAVGAITPIIGAALLSTGSDDAAADNGVALESMALLSPAAVLSEARDAVFEPAGATVPETATTQAATQATTVATTQITIPETPLIELAGEADTSAETEAATPASGENAPAAAPIYDELELIVRRNDTLDALFRRNGLSIADLATMLDIPLAARPLGRLMPGDRLNIAHNNGAIQRLERELGDAAILSITRDRSGFTATEIPREIDIRTVGRHGVVRSSLFEAGMAAEIPDAIIMRMAGIFQWDIDFILDVREGDHFTLLYEERWREGEMIGTGTILAAEYVNRGNRYRVVRFEDPTGHADHFTEDGRSVRKAFVRAPVEFTRISGSFNPNRRHPILNTIRAHRGVDYAAPTGTPVMAAGDGRIVQRGKNGGFGNSVTIQHGGNITTLYAHLSRFSSARRGDRVTQGEVIGYVGMTGLATGPHLHYEYRVNGVHRNPRTVELPPAEPVAAEYRAQFTSDADALWQQLDAFRSAFVAAAN